MFMESWILRVSCKVYVGFTYFARDPKYSRFHEHSKNWIHFLNVLYVPAHSPNETGQILKSRSYASAFLGPYKNIKYLLNYKAISNIN